MSISAVGNIIAITAYFFLTLLFFWVSHIPKANRSTLWWGVATLCTLMARLNLLMMPAHVSAHYVEAIYALFITIEKYCLIIGFVRFFSLKDLGQYSRMVPGLFLFEIVAIVALKAIANDSNIFATQFALFNFIILISIASLVAKNPTDYLQHWRIFLVSLLAIFSVHWATYPIAKHVDLWLQWGLIFGSFANLLLYLSLAMLALSSFQARLLRAEKKEKENARRALASSKAKSEFLANMSHEIRTPMNGVLGMLDVLKRSDLNEQQLRQVNIALSSSRSLLTLINDILDFSKIEANKLILEQRGIDLIETLDDIGIFLQQLAMAKNLELVVNTVGIEHPRVTGDAGRLRQIIVNLAGNAIKFTETGTIELRAKTSVTDTGEVKFTCNIVDTGIGISAEAQSTLFSAFSQADASTTRKYGGTGLGLAISTRLCELMRGTIAVESTPGKGSCFTFTLTFASSQDDAASGPKTSMKLSDKQIMVVDDNDTHLALIKDIFALWSCKPVLASSAKEAIAHIENIDAPLDLALIDVQMPEMDGEQLITHLQVFDKCNNTRFIAFSSTMNEELKARLYTAGVDECLLKPLVVHELKVAIQKTLARDKRSQPGYRNITDAPSPLNADKVKKKKAKLVGEELPRILLVEDNEINQFIAESLLADNGLSCDIAGHGEKALEMMKIARGSASYSLVLMDCQMPVMDGYQCTQHIRAGDAGEHNCDIPIIAMTANAMQGDREKCIASGMNDYLSKPIDTEAFVKVLSKWAR